LALQQLAEKPFGGILISTFLHQNIDPVAMGVNCPPVVTLDAIKNEGWTLNISRYVLPPVDEDITPLPETVAAFKEVLGEARAAEDQLRAVLTAGGWLQ